MLYIHVTEVPLGVSWGSVYVEAVIDCKNYWSVNASVNSKPFKMLSG